MCCYLCAELVMLLEWWSGTECTLYIDQATVDKFGKEHAIIILNHNFEIDFLCGWTMCERYGVLGVSNVAIYYCNFIYTVIFFFLGSKRYSNPYLYIME